MAGLRLVFKRGENPDTDFLDPYQLVVFQPSDRQIACAEDPNELLRFKGGKHPGVYVNVTKSELAKMKKNVAYDRKRFPLAISMFDIFGINWHLVDFTNKVSPDLDIEYFSKDELCPFLDEGENEDWVYCNKLDTFRKAFLKFTARRK